MNKNELRESCEKWEKLRREKTLILANFEKSWNLSFIFLSLHTGCNCASSSFNSRVYEFERTSHFLTQKA